MTASDRKSRPSESHKAEAEALVDVYVAAVLAVVERPLSEVGPGVLTTRCCVGL